MAIQTIKAGSRHYKVTAQAALAPGYPFLELGPAGTTTSVSTLVAQFNPDALWNGQFVVLGRVLGPASNAMDMPFVPIPYRRVSLNDVAQDYAMVTDPINGAALIHIPASGLSVVFAVAVGAGEMDLAMWDLQGNSAI